MGEQHVLLGILGRRVVLKVHATLLDDCPLSKVCFFIYAMIIIIVCIRQAYVL